MSDTAKASSADFRVLANELQAHGLQATNDYYLSQATTFRLGGPTPLLVDCATATQLLHACRLLRSANTPYFLMGGGSNLLVADAGPGLAVLRYQNQHEQAQLVDDQVLVSAAATFDGLAKFCCQHGLTNLVNASGIPGTVGGAIVGNAGAFGWQIGDDLSAIEILEPDGTCGWHPASSIAFAYRNSSLKRSGRIVVSAKLALPTGDPASLIAERQRILALRSQKHPNLAIDSCAGSFFRNVEPSSKAGRRQAAGWFLEEAGAKTMKVGGAAVYHKHANIPIKQSKDCRANDVARLTEQMAAAVYQKFQLELEPEVQRIGDFSSS